MQISILNPRIKTAIPPILPLSAAALTLGIILQCVVRKRIFVTANAPRPIQEMMKDNFRSCCFSLPNFNTKKIAIILQFETFLAILYSMEGFFWKQKHAKTQEL
jgi:hypothetical protein